MSDGNKKGRKLLSGNILGFLFCCVCAVSRSIKSNSTVLLNLRPPTQICEHSKALRDRKPPEDKRKDASEGEKDEVHPLNEQQLFEGEHQN